MLGQAAGKQRVHQGKLSKTLGSAHDHLLPHSGHVSNGGSMAELLNSIFSKGEHGMHGKLILMV